MTAPERAVLSEESIRFYLRALEILRDARVPHLVGGAYAFARYTGIERHTKDFDVFLRRDDFRRAAWAFRKAGYKVEFTFPHWLGKVFDHDAFVDLIYSSGNGVAIVDDAWFTHAVKDKVFGVDVELIPPEEMIWSKGTIMERERYDGADVAHVIRAVGDRLDWRRLIERYGKYWRVLYAHVVAFGFVYPSDREQVPSWVIDELGGRMRGEQFNASEKICYGTLISRQQYLKAIQEWGYADARRADDVMSDEDITRWTAGIEVDGTK